MLIINDIAMLNLITYDRNTIKSNEIETSDNRPIPSNGDSLKFISKSKAILTSRGELTAEAMRIPFKFKRLSCLLRQESVSLEFIVTCVLVNGYYRNCGQEERNSRNRLIPAGP